MSFPRRLIAALSGALLLQLTLLGSGTICVESGTAAPVLVASTVVGADVSDMAGMGHGEPSPGAPAGCNETNVGSGCPIPSVPGGCTSMTTCSATAAPVAMLAGQLPLIPYPVDLSDPVGMRSGPPLAPELPPPRA